MPRFSLSPAPSEDSHINYREEEDYKEEEGDYEEPPHPVGFGSPWGRTWFSLEPPVLDLPGQCRYGLDEDDDDDGFHHIQSFPPISTYIDARTAPTRVLLRIDKQPRPEEEEEEDDMDRLAQLLSAARIVERLPPQPSFQSPPPWSQTKQVILQKVQSHRERMQQEHLEAARSLKMLLQETDRQTAKILRQREVEEQAYRQQEEKRQQVQEQEKKAQDTALAANEQKRQQVQAKKEQLLQESQDVKKAQQEKEAQKTEYVTKAKQKVAQLVQIRASIEPFDTSKAVSKRRLQMKKIVRGKVNTLSEDAHKVQSVAVEVAQAIGAARTEDEQLRQRIQQGDPSVTPEMARGKRYLVDLVASNAIQRVQAEGFNGTRGDGFPLAAMLTLVSMDNKEFVPVMAAHIYTVCPTAIPTLPTLKHDASEDEVMSSLGMLKDKTGEFETFPRFLSRTEVSTMNEMNTSYCTFYTITLITEKNTHASIAFVCFISTEYHISGSQHHGFDTRQSCTSWRPQGCRRVAFSIFVLVTSGTHSPTAFDHGSGTDCLSHWSGTHAGLQTSRTFQKVSRFHHQRYFEASGRRRCRKTKFDSIAQDFGGRLSRLSKDIAVQGFARTVQCNGWIILVIIITWRNKWKWSNFLCWTACIFWAIVGKWYLIEQSVWWWGRGNGGTIALWWRSTTTTTRALQQ
jgi:hypothetical protein